MNNSNKTTLPLGRHTISGFTNRRAIPCEDGNGTRYEYDPLPDQEFDAELVIDMDRIRWMIHAAAHNQKKSSKLSHGLFTVKVKSTK